MEPIEVSETSVNDHLTPGNYPKESILQLIHYLLNIQNVKIYIKMLYSHSYMFRSPMTIIRELSTEPGLSYTFL
jgi:hypothetical protein